MGMAKLFPRLSELPENLAHVSPVYLVDHENPRALVPVALRFPAGLIKNAIFSNSASTFNCSVLITLRPNRR
jgi:hypothetical protein